MGWRRRTSGRATARAARSAQAARPDLRTHLPLMWPSGPDGPVDLEALRALSREYARTGRGVEDLLADVDELCAVLGLGASSSLIETSSVAWADAFLDTVGGLAPATKESLATAEVERRLVEAGPAWQDLELGSRLLIVTGPEVPTTDRGGLARVAAEIRTVFPGAAVAEQPARNRIVAAVDGGPDLEPRVAAVRARCAELVLSSALMVRVVAVPADPASARQLLRGAG